LISLSLWSRHGRAIKKEGSEGFFFLIDIEEA
jgi:flagellar biosynthesis regulator FlaF